MLHIKEVFIVVNMCILQFRNFFVYWNSKAHQTLFPNLKRRVKQSSVLLNYRTGKKLIGSYEDAIVLFHDIEATCTNYACNVAIHCRVFEKELKFILGEKKASLYD